MCSRVMLPKILWGTSVNVGAPSVPCVKTQDAEYSFHSELEEMMGVMIDYAHAHSMVPSLEGIIQRLWDPIHVSPYTKEAEYDIVGED